MKFSFKIRQYQTDAVEAVARIFQGQSYNAGVSYIRDAGTLQRHTKLKKGDGGGDSACLEDSNSRLLAAAAIQGYNNPIDKIFARRYRDGNAGDTETAA